MLKVCAERREPDIVRRVSRGGRRVTRASVAVKRDVFPTTHRTWIDQALGGSSEDRQELNRHIMAVYAHPLRVYYLGTGSRWLGDPDEIVAGFFADRLARDNFLTEWRREGMRLRRWLMNAFSFYLSELRRRRQRDNRMTNDVPELATPGSSPERMADRAFGESIVAEALRIATEACRDQKLEHHWGIFIRHTCDDVPYAQLAAEFGLTPARAAVMARTAARHFRKALRGQLLSDGADETDVDDAIRDLLETVET